MKATTTKTPRKAANKAATKAAVKPVYDHKQGNVTVSLPALPKSVKTRPISPLELGHSGKAVIRVNGLGNNKPVVLPAKQGKTKLNMYGTTKGYGDRWPTEGTSGAAIWAALQANQCMSSSVTKVWAEKLAGMNLVTGKGSKVNPANLAIEINAYKKYLNFHGLLVAPIEKVA